MAFRSQAEALRARVAVLEAELEEARARILELEADQEEITSLRARVAELEDQLGVRRPMRPGLRRLAAGLALLAVPVVASFSLLTAGSPFTAGGLASGPDLDGVPARGTIDLANQPYPEPITGDVRGRHEASEVSPGCAGYVPTAPLVGLRLEEPTRVHLWTESHDDLVLLVRSETGQVFCDDDSGQRMNPMLDAHLGAGEHRVWVGTYAAGASARFELRVDARPLDQALAVDVEPSLRALEADGEAHFTVDGRTEGVLAADRVRPGCAGYVPLVPHVTLDVSEPSSASFATRSGIDSVLLVRRPDGSFVCDDDGGRGTDSLLTLDVGAGRHSVWVGTYAPHSQGDFTLTVDVPARFDWNFPPRLGRWDLDDEELLSFRERVQARTRVNSVQPDCRRFYGPGRADLELTLETPRAVTLSLASDEWLGLLVQHPDGTQSCDPSLDGQPHRWEVGLHRVWVLAPEPDAGTPFTLVVQAQDL